MAGYFDLGTLSAGMQSEPGTRSSYDNYQGYNASTGLEFGPQAMFRANGYQTDTTRDGLIDTKEEGFGLYRDMVKANNRFNRDISQGNQEAGKLNAFGVANAYKGIEDTSGEIGTFGGVRLSGFRTLGGDPNMRMGFSAQRGINQGLRQLTMADDYRNSVALSGALGVASRNTGAGSLGYNSNMSADYLRRAYSLTRPGQSATAGASWANNALGGGAAGLGNYRFGLM
jgi:hypothetical protein